MAIKSNIEEFIEKAKFIYKDEYDYSRSIYINNKIKIEIICNKCNNIFWQNPNHHLLGHGCPRYANNIKSNVQEFIKKAQNIHGNNCGYGKTNYINARIKVEIICPIHGSFWQKPNDHLLGHGCPQCSESKMERKLSKFFQENNIEFEREKEFEGLIGVGGGLLRFDFWLSKRKVLIECDGPQHHKFIKGMQTLKKHQNLLEHDKRKNEWCMNNNYILIRLKEKDFENNNYKIMLNQTKQ